MSSLLEFIVVLYLIHVRIAIFQFYGFIERTKYYAIWTLTEVCFFAKS